MNSTQGRHALKDNEPERAGVVRRLPSHTLSDLLMPMSGAIDLAEGRAFGHGRRVAYVALSLAGSLALEPQTRLACCYAALFHDIGVIAAGAGLSGLAHGDERLVFSSIPPLSPEEVALGAASASPHLLVERIVDHVVHGARAAQELALPSEAVSGISVHHEKWDGSGYPHGLSAEEIPIVGRVTSLADEVESLISQEPSPLLARRNLPYWLGRLSGTQADPRIVNAMLTLGSGDLFWLGLYSADLQSDLMAQCARLREPKAARLFPFLESFALLVDARFSFTHGVSSRVSQIVEELGRGAGLAEQRLKQLQAAALLHDVGQLCVSERILAKPGILTVEELEVLRQHPAYSSDILAGISGLEEAAAWVAAHHERPDGRGYPEGLRDQEIPLEARILAIADSYVAITSDRPHREKASAAEGIRQLRSAAGSQLDRELVDLFLERMVA